MSKKDLLSQCREALGDATLTNLDLLNLIGGNEEGTGTRPHLRSLNEQGGWLNADNPQIQPCNGRIQGIQGYAVRRRNELY